MPDFSPLVQKTLQVAKSHVGQREATGRNDGWLPRLVQRFVARGARWLDNAPWCACWVTYCVHEAARVLHIEPEIPRNASSSSLYAWAKKHGKLLAFPQAGCIGLVRAGGQGDHDGRRDRGKSHVHTFFVHDIQDGVLVTVEGNFRNAVTWNKRRRPWGCDFMRIC